MSLAHGKILVHLKDRRRLVIDADDIYDLEAQGDETDIRLRGARLLLDVLEPPVNKVLPVSRGSLARLLQAYRPS